MYHTEKKAVNQSKKWEVTLDKIRKLYHCHSYNGKSAKFVYTNLFQQNVM